MFQMTVVHPACSWIYHTLLKDFAITIKICLAPGDSSPLAYASLLSSSGAPAAPRWR